MLTYERRIGAPRLLSTSLVVFVYTDNNVQICSHINYMALKALVKFFEEEFHKGSKLRSTCKLNTNMDNCTA